MVKQIIVVRTEIQMGKGKMAAQAWHASLGAYKKIKKTDSKLVSLWESEGEAKIVLRGNLEEVIDLKKWADAKKLPSYLVSDAGRTQLEPGTITALAIGPCLEEKLKETEKLKLL